MDQESFYPSERRVTQADIDTKRRGMFNYLSFGEYTVFADNCTFPCRTIFHERCVFGKGCHFGYRCHFKGPASFGDNCTFEDGCEFEKICNSCSGPLPCHLDTPFVLHDRFSGTVFGFSFGEGCRLGNGCQVVVSKEFKEG